MILDASQVCSNSDYGMSLTFCSVAHHTCIRNILSCESFQETDLIIISWIWGSLIICERIAMHSWIDFSNPYASDELSNASKSWKTASLWHGLHGSRGRKLTTHHKQHCVDKTGWDSCHGYTCNLHHIIMHIYHLWGSFWLDTQALSASLTCMFAFHRHLLRDGLLCCTTETTRESGMQMAQMVLLPFISWHSQIFPAWAFYASIIARTWAPFPSNLLSECVSLSFWSRGRDKELYYLDLFWSLTCGLLSSLWNWREQIFYSVQGHFIALFPFSLLPSCIPSSSFSWPETPS